MAEERNIAEVLDTMIELVPADQSALKAALEEHRHSACYQPPERMFEIWGRVAAEFAVEFGTSPPEWAYPILKVFLGSNWTKVRESLGIEWNE